MERGEEARGRWELAEREVVGVRVRQQPWVRRSLSSVVRRSTSRHSRDRCAQAAGGFAQGHPPRWAGRPRKTALDMGRALISAGDYSNGVKLEVWRRWDQWLKRL